MPTSTIGSTSVAISVQDNGLARGMDRAGRSVGRAQTRFRGLQREILQFNNAVARTQRRLGRLATSFAAIAGVAGIGGLVRGYVQAADSLEEVRARISIVTDSSEELGFVMQQLIRISQDTRSSFIGTADSYARIAQAEKASRNQH